MIKQLALAGAVGIGVLIAGGGGAKAQLQVNPVPSDTSAWAAETGQSIPTGTGGYINGALQAGAAGVYTFTFGPMILSGATGYGDSSYQNIFFVGSDLATAEAAGTVFCNFACGFNSTNAPFSVSLSAGNIQFGFVADQSGSNATINNGDAYVANQNNGAYLVTTASSFAALSGTANAGPNTYAYLGLSDHTVPSGDTDFQDLTVQVSAPEPASMALLGVGLIGLGALRRRRG